ncbi:MULTISPECIES: acyl-CoA dehydrogenase family protein [unclassified Rhodococcus (in: high G+C Gram-positive bacteria)]|uniref:acyl-CoA dehydrogenase family protein n=1 Tax=unclassified Rhodococcus (in: high G+C Gram-positive bacteria) TaxID=192944 RepID=UPI0006FD241D|nr:MULTISPECIES: acyl-CoA dehydrogenase family protein [unclassified Rhodococcus (in: high G+C Gram-positive bacteria)]KQU28492.1 hypothetical protein ASG69_10840 [Rhodococcus sp. Leaf225]KQU47627.1 hypothetical protein ASH03_21220 [Rhodococcus sp. Leaf258]
MISLSSELEEFLTTAAKVATSVADSSDSVTISRGALESTGLLDLAGDVADESDGLAWLAHTVRVVAQTSPSLAFVLAGRYAADHVGHSAGSGGSAFGLAFAGAATVLSSALDPDRAVVWDAATGSVFAAPFDSIGADGSARRSGLAQADLVSVTIASDSVVANVEVSELISRWDLLTGAALVGIGRRAVAETQAYVMGRHQFGVAIGSFVGLRALVADMDLRVGDAEALLSRALDGEASAPVSASAGRAAVATCIDAVQAHGGYGYIDEYPIAGLLRDAISTQARAGGRRFHVARVAQLGLGSQAVLLP